MSGVQSPRLPSSNVLFEAKIEVRQIPSTHGCTVVQLRYEPRIVTVSWPLSSVPERTLVAIPRSRYLTLAVGEHVRVSPRRGWRSTWRGHLHRPLDSYKVRKYKTTRAALPRLADRRRPRSLPYRAGALWAPRSSCRQPMMQSWVMLW